jgi:hypothetical protein
MTHRHRYDAENDPEAKRWLELDESERQDAIMLYHERLRTQHPETPEPLLHAIVHMVVENQVAMNDPPEVRSALAALRKHGRSRHEAIHTIGIAVTHWLHELANLPDSADPNELHRHYVDKLQRIRAEESE